MKLQIRRTLPPATAEGATPLGRRAWIGFTIVASGLVLASAPAEAQASLQEQRALHSRAEAIMTMSYTRFMEVKRSMEVKGKAKRGLDEKFNWVDDGCSPSWAPAWLYRNLFEEQCKQHDFGYRNFGSGLALGRNEDTRAWIDRRFRTEMRRRCAKFDGVKAANGVKCRSDADVVYDAVRGTPWGRGAYYKAINNPRRTLVGHIVQWDRDNKQQRTAWLVGADGKRRWIPSSSDYNCFKGRGHLGPTVLRADTLDLLPELNGTHATCTTPHPPPPPPPPAPPSPAPPSPAPVPPAPAPPAPTGERMCCDARLHAAGDGHLRSIDGRYRFVMQADGNLVLYAPSGAIWRTSTVGRGANHLRMQGDGNLVMYDGANRPIWASNTPRHYNTFLIVQNDGNVVIYDNGRAIWATGTAGRT